VHKKVLITVGIDIGSSAIKVALLEHPRIAQKMVGGERPDPGDGQDSRVLGVRLERIRKRAPNSVASLCLEQVLAGADLSLEDIQYVSTTGEGDTFPLKTGYFFGMTTHSRGANFLFPEARSVLDVGALHQRAMVVDERSKVLNYRMTGQCASGSGQFLENISRYLGVTTDEIGPLSLKSDTPEKVSGICAVLAETDVINMVSRGISNEDILKGIHVSLSGRMAKLFRSAGGVFPLVITGGLALDAGLIKTLEEELVKKDLTPEIRTHELSPFAGAIGAALWGAFRCHKKETESVNGTRNKPNPVAAGA
jgi:benzoyl-CoA reductase subunit D